MQRDGSPETEAHKLRRHRDFGRRRRLVSAVIVVIYFGRRRWLVGGRGKGGPSHRGEEGVSNGVVKSYSLRRFVFQHAQYEMEQGLLFVAVRLHISLHPQRTANTTQHYRW